MFRGCLLRFFFFNDTATTEIYTLSLHDALPIWVCVQPGEDLLRVGVGREDRVEHVLDVAAAHHEREPRVQRSEEHTSELQSRQYLVCRLLLEKKKNTNNPSALHIRNSILSNQNV